MPPGLSPPPTRRSSQPVHQPRPRRPRLPDRPSSAAALESSRWATSAPARPHSSHPRGQIHPAALGWRQPGGWAAVERAQVDPGRIRRTLHVEQKPAAVGQKVRRAMGCCCGPSVVTVVATPPVAGYAVEGRAFAANKITSSVFHVPPRRLDRRRSQGLRRAATEVEPLQRAAREEPD